MTEKPNFVNDFPILKKEKDQKNSNKNSNKTSNDSS